MNKIKNFFLKNGVQTAVASLVIFLAVWIVYANSIGNEFLWDDDAGIIFNNYIHDWQYFLNFFSQSMYNGAGIISGYWRPAVLTVFAVEWHTFLVWPGGYHIVNILLHGINALLVFYLFRLLFGRFFIAFMTALVFGVHPLNTEAVTYISGIADSLCALFVLLGVIFYVKAGNETEHRRKRLFFLAVFLCFILALMSRESAIMMPGLLFLADIFRKRNEVKNWRNLKNPLKTVLPFLLFDGSYIISRLTILNFTKEFTSLLSFNLPLHERIFTFFHALLLYLQLMFAPLHLHMERFLVAEKTLMSPPVLAGGLALGLIFFLIFKTFKKIPEVSFGLSWFLIALSPSANIFMPSATALAEHWLYLSLPGFFFALFVLVDKISRSWRYRSIIFVFLTVWILWIGNLTILRNRDWANPIVLFTSTLQESPESSRANTNLGLAYEKKKEYDKALLYLTRATEIEPNNPLPFYLRALVYAKMGKNTESMRDHEHSVSINVNNTHSTAFLLSHYSMRNDFTKVREILEQVLEKTTSPMKSQDILLKIISVAKAEKNDALVDKYEKMLAETRLKVQDDPIVKIGNFLNKYLGEIE
ncbi:MAG: tetratricopeptide repeat protein [Candidatus Paceibacterota bacterium]|jgi:tetratricopeptide (TPR) repeat protein